MHFFTILPAKTISTVNDIFPKCLGKFLKSSLHYKNHIDILSCSKWRISFTHQNITSGAAYYSITIREISEAAFFDYAHIPAHLNRYLHRHFKHSLIFFPVQNIF